MRSWGLRLRGLTRGAWRRAGARGGGGAQRRAPRARRVAAAACRRCAPLLLLVVLAVAIGGWVRDAGHAHSTASPAAGLIAPKAQRKALEALAPHLSSWEAAAFSGRCPRGVFTPIRTSSWKAAVAVCMLTPGCGAASRHVLTGDTLLCEAVAATSAGAGVLGGLLGGWRTEAMGACSHHSYRLALLHEGTATHAGCAHAGLPGFALAPMLKPLGGTGGGGWRCEKHGSGTTVAQEAAAACLDAGIDRCEVFARRGDGLTMLCVADSERNRRTTPALHGGGWVLGCRRSGDACARASPSMPRGAGVVTEWGPVVRGRTGAPPEPSAHELKAELASTAGRSGVAVATRMLRQRGNAQCAAAQTLLRTFTASDTYAESMCAAEPLCTVWTRLADTGKTWLCQGYMKIHNSPRDKSYAVGFKRGCEWYRGTRAEDDSRLLRPPTCLETGELVGNPLRELPSCPAPSVPIPVFTKGVRAMPLRPVCDECEHGGICPRLESTGDTSEEAGRMRSALTKVARQQLAPLTHIAPKAKELAGAFNPSLAIHRGEMYIAYRQATATRCSGKTIEGTYELDDPKLGQYASKIGICPTYEDTIVPRQLECVQLNPMQPPPRLDGMVLDEGGFVGEEDARLFSFRNTLYVLFNVGVTMADVSTDEQVIFAGRIRVRRMLLASVDPRTGKTGKPLLIRIPGLRATDNVKNVMPLVKPSEVLLVHNIWPLGVCSLDVVTGACGAPAIAAPPRAHGDISAYKAVGSLSGSTQFAAVPAGFIGLVHRKQDMELGRLYTHKWVLISKEHPHTLVWLSAPFRLPAALARSECVLGHPQGCREGRFDLEDDVQFASGVVVDLVSKTALVSYGVADCYSWVARVALPPEAMRQEPGLDDAPLALVTRVPTSVPDDARPRPVVRWDSPLTDMSGFAFVTRAMAELFLADGTFTFQMWNRFDGSRAFEADRYGEMYASAIRSQADLVPQPDVTVRMYWEPNFQPAPAGKLVVYLPWEFGPIPTAWVESLNAVADEVWVPADAVVEGMLQSGVDRHKLAVVPHGVSTQVCKDPVVDAALKSKLHRRNGTEGGMSGGPPFSMLYHGGMLFRKGVPQLIEAYQLAFTGRDNVELVVHSVYGDATVEAMLQEHVKAAVSDPRLPRLRKDGRRLQPDELAEMYLEADVLVHSSLSEGLGLGVVEAMAHGLPVIASEYGPPADFVTRSNGFLFPAKQSPCKLYPCAKDSRSVFSQDWTTTSDLVWGEYSPEALAGAMRDAYDNRATLTERGMRARREICTDYSWETAHSIAKERLLELAAKP